jgi:hypothetical protein
MSAISLRTAAVVAVLISTSVAHAQSFDGAAQIEQVDAIHWKLLAPLTYTDKDNVAWLAPRNYVTDGATIPPLLWPIIGSPFTGNYVRAAIIHDVYCDLKSRDWKLVHRTFYDAMITGGVTPIQAKIMYYAVYRFGPKWVVDKTVKCPLGFICDQAGPPLQVTLEARPQLNVDDAKRAKAKIEQQNPDVEEIEKMADEELFSKDSQIQVSGTEKSSNGDVRTLNQSFPGSTLYRTLSSD